MERHLSGKSTLFVLLAIALAIALWAHSIAARSANEEIEAAMFVGMQVEWRGIA